MKREELSFDSRDQKTKIHAIQWTPVSVEVRGVIQIIHGMAEHIERYEDFAKFLGKQGFVVVLEDHLGHGKTASSSSALGYFCEQDPATVLVRDVHRLKKIVQEKYPGLPYIVMGHSMGSMILRNYLFRYGQGIDGAVIIGTNASSNATLAFGKILTGILKLIYGEKHKSELLNKISFGNCNKKVPQKRTIVDWLSTDPKVVDRYMGDPLCGFTFTINGFQTILELFKSMQNEENLKKIPKDLPLLIISGEEDPIGEYGKVPKELYDTYLKLGLTKVQLKLYNGARHEVLNETNKKEVYEDLKNWVLSIVEKATE